MGALKWMLAISGATLAASARAEAIDNWRVHIAEASARFAIPEIWIERVMRAESNGKTILGGRPIRSRAGAIGLMQLMPGTWAEMRMKYHLGSDPDDPHDNILAGAAYLRAMYESFGYPGLFSAYNAGPGRYEAYLRRGTPLPRETVSYTARVLGASGAAVLAARPKPVPALFAVQNRADSALASARKVAVSGDGLFAVRRGER